MTPGIYDSLSNQQYHGGPGINKGLLDLVHRSPAHAHFAMTAANDNREPTAAQSFGTAFHSLVLEPADFAARYVRELTADDYPADCIRDRDALVSMVQELNAGRLPKLPTGGTKADVIARIIENLPASTNAADLALAEKSAAELKAEIDKLNESRHGLLPTAGSMAELADILARHGRIVRLASAFRAEWDAKHEGAQVLPADDWARLHAMREAVMAHPAARALLTGAPGRAEMSVYWVDAVTGELCRCRPDWWRADGVLVDLKTTEDASPEGFAKSLVNWRYHVQAPYYVDGTAAAWDAGHAPQGWERPKAFAFIAVEKKAPHGVGVYVLDQESDALGRIEYRADLSRLAECKRTGVWPGYGDAIQPLGVPQWYLHRNAALLGAA